MAEDIGVAQEFITTEADMETNSTVIYAGPCILRAVYVNEILDTQDVIIENATGTQQFVIPNQSIVGTPFPFYDVTLDGLTVNPDDAATTGKLAFIWKPFTNPYDPIP